MLNISRYIKIYQDMKQINNITEEINNNVNVIDKTKKQDKFTEKKKLAFEKMKEAKKEARKKEN